jgi:CRP-like cAMP-binding protein
MKAVPCQRAPEDALEYLPCSAPVTYEKGALVYGGRSGPAGLYVVLAGRVKIWRAGADGVAMILGIHGPEQIFGETSFVPASQGEYATALERTQVMMWPAAAIEDLIDRTPRLGIALMQKMVARGAGLKERIRDMAAEKTPARVALTLLALAEESGSPTDDGGLWLAALTHQTISELVGTSREIVTAEMGALRRYGLVNYNRRGIRVYPGALREHIHLKARLPQPPRTLRAVRRMEAAS